MTSRGRPPHPDILTPREWEVLALLRERLSNEQIAMRLGITERTARFHVSEILSKLGVAGREEAALWNPEERKPWWMALLHWPIRWSIVVKIAGASIVAGAAGGIGLLAWGVAATHGPSLDDEPRAVVQSAGPITAPTEENPVVVCGKESVDQYPFATNEAGGRIPISQEECDEWTGIDWSP